MTPNEKELLEKIREAGQASAVTMCKEMVLSLDYTQTLCKNLAAQGHLTVVTAGRWPVYEAKEKERKKKKGKKVK